MGQFWSGSSGSETDTNLYVDSLDEHQPEYDDRTASKRLCEEYNTLINLLRNELQPDTISRVEYVGSVYKRTGIKSSDLDNLFIKRNFTIQVEHSAEWGGHVLLKTQSGFIFGGSLIDPVKKRQEFKGKVQRALNNIGYSNRAKLADHGPAIELRYDYNKVQFNVDLVFSYEVAEGEMYIAKPPARATGKDLSLWKRSTAIEEKRRMRKIDRDNKASRWAVKIIKALIQSEPNLHILTSYVVEQALYHIRNEIPDVFWVENNMKEIIRKLLETMADAVERGSLSNKFNPYESNVLTEMSSNARSNVVNRLRRLAKDPHLQRVVDNIPKEL